MTASGWDKLTADERADIEAHVRGKTEEKPTYEMPAHGWTCFHCGETFKTLRGARLHFGSLEPKQRADIIKAVQTNVRVRSDRASGYAYYVTPESAETVADAVLTSLPAACQPSGGWDDAAVERARDNLERLATLPADGLKFGDYEQWVHGRAKAARAALNAAAPRESLRR